MSKVYPINMRNDTVLLERYPYGILSPATTNGGKVPDHFGDRLVYTTSERVAVNLFSDVADNVTASVVVGTGPFARTYIPFQIEVRLVASTFGTTPAEVEQLARSYMEIATQKAIEKEVWTGDIARAAGFTDNRYLTEPTATALIGAHAPDVDLALLEQALADCGIGEVGLIHIPSGVASVLGTRLGIEKGGYLTTRAGNKVVVGSGYVNDTPLTPTMAATGPMTVEVGAITPVWQKPSEATDVSTNQIEYIFTREAAVTWSNGCHYTITTDLTA